MLRARLAIDQFDLAKQTQVVCFHAEECMGQLSQKKAPLWEGEADSVANLKARIDHAIQFLRSLDAADFTGWEERATNIFFAPNMYLPGISYLTELELPNFFFSH